MQDVDLSVVLCTWSNAERLEITLEGFESVRSPDGVEWELIAVDNNSTDHTEAVIESFRRSLPIRYEYEPEQGKSHALNTGVRVAEGELIVFTDDDVTPVSQWLEAYWQSYQARPEGFYFGGPIESEYEEGPPDEDLLRAAFPSVAGLDYGNSSRSFSSSPAFNGANWACPVQHLAHVGAFNEAYGITDEGGKSMGEETDFMRRLQAAGVRGWYVPEAKIRHFVPAEKCTLQHVVSRVTATDGLYEPGSPMPTTILGVPLGLYRTAVWGGLQWVGRRIAGRPWKKEYVQWRSAIARIKAYHQRRVNARARP